MVTAILNACKTFINRVKNQLKQLTKPATANLALEMSNGRSYHHERERPFSMHLVPR